DVRAARELVGRVADVAFERRIFDARERGAAVGDREEPAAERIRDVAVEPNAAEIDESRVAVDADRAAVAAVSGIAAAAGRAVRDERGVVEIDRSGAER